MIRFMEFSNRKNSLITSRLAAFNLIQERAGKLIRAAEFAYGRRDLTSMEAISLDLLNSPIEQGQNAGLYYLAIAAKWHGRLIEAQVMLDKVRGQYQARAIQALGAMEFEAGRFDEAGRLHKESIIAAKDNDVFVTTVAQAQISAIRSMYGDHRQAFNDLYDLWPMMQILIKPYPYLYSALHNEIACEFLELGRIEEAAHASSIALASPFAVAYPEWRETNMEIARRGYRASRSVVAVVGMPASEPENVVHLDAWPIDRAAQEPPSDGLARVRDFEEWKTEMAKGQKKESGESLTDYDELKKRTEIYKLISDTDLTQSQLDRLLNLLREFAGKKAEQE